MLYTHTDKRPQIDLFKLCAAVQHQEGTAHIPVPDLRQARAPLQVANKQIFDSTVGTTRQQHRDGLPIVPIALLCLHGPVPWQHVTLGTRIDGASWKSGSQT